MKAFITDYSKNCSLCGTPSTEIHHLLFGTSGRKLADQDQIYIPVCRKCHEEIHANSTASRLSKILGQVCWEMNDVADKELIFNAREQFRKRYGKSYL